MSLATLLACARDKTRFERIEDYQDFARRFLDFAADGLQAIIVSQNETHYQFWQYRGDGRFNITRPINSRLMYDAAGSGALTGSFLAALDQTRSAAPFEEAGRETIRRSIYTLQQCIGATLDALPSGESNAARKINGDLFERLIRLLIRRLGIDCTSGTVRVPVEVVGEAPFFVQYQHDLIIHEDGAVKGIGSVKTSSKDRLDKIFVDKFLYGRLTGRDVPHFAVCLNDVQRKKTKIENRHGISATFLPGRFKAYTIKLNPLDGVYYCDLRPNMAADPLLSQHIRTIDHFFCTDLWRFVRREGDALAAVESSRVLETPADTDFP